ncbi:conserved hypothetical protein [Nocardia seriolae]|nr:conserved hypothetical protein [Nocardia seriolae]
MVTRAQAIAAMELAELLHDTTATDHAPIQATIAATAEQLGIRPIDVAIAFSARYPYR